MVKKNMRLFFFISLFLTACPSYASRLNSQERHRKVFSFLETSSATLQSKHFEIGEVDLTVIPKDALSWSSSPLASNWNDYWFEWASQKLDFPETTTEEKVNVLLSLGNLRIPKTFDFLIQKIRNRFDLSEVRRAAIEALERWGGFLSAKFLFDQLKIEKNPEIKLALSEALNKMGGRPNERLLEISPGKDGASRMEWQ